MQKLDPQDHAANMRAAIAGVRRQCWNCKYLIAETKGPWCQQRQDDPAPDKPGNHIDQVCSDWNWNQSRK